MPDVPKELERIILRCLRKEPGRRFQHMADVKVELQEVKEESDSQAAAPAGAATRRADRGALDGVAAAGVAGPGHGGGRDAVAPARGPSFPPRASSSSRRTRRAERAASRPTATQIAFPSAGETGSNSDIWLKIIGEAEARRLTTDPAADD